MRFIIRDWAGNRILPAQEFTSSESAWDAIQEMHQLETCEAERCLEEYYVEPKQGAE
jgi:hypothetical protein